MELKPIKNEAEYDQFLDWVDEQFDAPPVSALLNRKKPLTLKLAKLFHEKLGIPAQVLLS